MIGIKGIIRKIPFVAQGAKLFYDWEREEKLILRIKKLSKQSSLPFKNKADTERIVGALRKAGLK